MPALIDYTESDDGLLILGNGIRSVLKWDSLRESAEVAGIAAPTSKVTLTKGSNAGGVLGTYTVYVRYIDANGNVSNLSPVSDSITVESAVTNSKSGVRLAFFNETPIRVRSDGHGLVNGNVVKISNVGGLTTANGTFSVTVLSPNQFTLDSSVSGDPWEPGTGQYTSGADKILVTAIPVSPDQKVTRKQILRNTDGQASTYYIEKTIDNNQVSVNLVLSDTALRAKSSVPLFDSDGTDLAISRHTPPPNDRVALANHQDRMFAAGPKIFKRGQVSVTADSKTVTAIGTIDNDARHTWQNRWTSEMAGRTFTVNGGLQEYIIDEVDENAQTLTLTTPYAEATNAFVDYSISPDRSTFRTIYYSEAGLPESWPPINAITIQQEKDHGRITGLMPFGSFLYILEEGHIYRLTYQVDPGKDGSVFLTRARRGCINNRCWVLAESTAYMMDRAGLHKFSGEDSATISAAIQKIFDPKSDAFLKINWSKSEMFHAVLDEPSEVIRWFVCMGTSRYPKHAIAYDYRNQRLWIEEYTLSMGDSASGEIASSPTVFFGSQARRVLAQHGSLDGPINTQGTLYGTATSATPMSISDTSATFPTNADWDGYPIAIVSGRGKGQIRTIANTAANRIDIRDPWRIEPDTTSKYQIGAIKWNYKTPTYRLLGEREGYDKSLMINLEVMFSPTSLAGFFDIRVFQDRSATPVVWKHNYDTNQGDGASITADNDYIECDMSKSRGYVNQRIDKSSDYRSERVKHMSVELRGFSNNNRFAINELTIDAVHE